MGKDSQLHKALREYWKETKQKQRERDKELAKKFLEQSSGETFSEFKHKEKIKRQSTPF